MLRQVGPILMRDGDGDADLEQSGQHGAWPQKLGLLTLTLGPTLTLTLTISLPLPLTPSPGPSPSPDPTPNQAHGRRSLCRAA